MGWWDRWLGHCLGLGITEGLAWATWRKVQSACEGERRSDVALSPESPEGQKYVELLTPTTLPVPSGEVGKPQRWL